MQIRDRIKEFRRVPARSLRPHPRNWRTHPESQQQVMRGVLAEIGYADALVARELADGSLQLIDGHLRAELTPEALVPVLVVDVTEEEALKLLATLDPIAALAGSNDELLRGLVAEIETESQAVRKLLDDLAGENPLEGAESAEDIELTASFQVVVECADEDEQREVYERLRGEGFKCRVLSL